MAPYAENTTVEAAKSQSDIAAIITKHGATGYQFGWQDDNDGGRAAIMFRAHDRTVRFLIPMPNPDDPQFRRTETGRARQNPRAAYEQEVKRRWRTLYLTIKAKLIAVDDEVTSFEEEFLAHIMVPGTNDTVYTQLQERLQTAYETGDPIDLVPTLPAVRYTSDRQIEPPR